MQSTSTMANNLQQLRSNARPKASDKVDALSSKLNNQTKELASLPATGDKDKVANALRSIHIFNCQ